MENVTRGEYNSEEIFTQEIFIRFVRNLAEASNSEIRYLFLSITIVERIVSGEIKLKFSSNVKCLKRVLMEFRWINRICGEQKLAWSRKL